MKVSTPLFVLLFILKGDMWMEFQLEKIDIVETKKAVESALEKYRMMLLKVELDRQPKVTQSFSFMPHSETNKFHSSTEDAALTNINYDQERIEYIKKVSMAVNRLAYKERAILIKRFMTEEHVFDYEVYNDLNISARTYHRHKSKAFYKLAFALKIEVYEDHKEATGA